MSTPDLHLRAAQFFLLAEQACFLERLSRRLFWEMSTAQAMSPSVRLPGIAAAVRHEETHDVLLELAHHPLPGVLLPEAVPWHDHLVETWEVQRARASDDWVLQNAARLALVRLDGCGMPDGMERPSRLPEWLAEARRMVGAGYEPARTELKALAVLAEWRPAPGVVTSPETLREWVAFWREMRRSRSPLIKGIAARALLNLPEADLQAASLQPVPPEKLLHDLAAAIPAAAERTAASCDGGYLLLLNWQPGENSLLPAAGVAQVARAWLEVALQDAWWCRQPAWWQLIRWDRAGSLATCGMDLLPRLVRAAQTEKDSDVLWEMARWTPVAEVFTGTEKPDGLALLRELEAHWQRHRQSGDWRGRASAWLAGIRLHRAGLATESPDSFREAYLSTVARESNADVLFVLAQWAPGPNVWGDVQQEWQPVWQQHLEEDDEYSAEVAGYALLHQVFEKGTGASLRHLGLELWRIGTKKMEEVNATTCWLKTVLFRLQTLQAQLAAGNVPHCEVDPTPPAERQYPRLALPPGRIAGGEWKVENGKWKIEGAASDAPSR